MASFADLNAAQQEAFLSSPVLEPPEGQVSNLVNPPNGAAGSEAVLAIAFVLSTIAVIGRVYARFILLKKRFLSDYIILLGYAFTVVLYVYDEHMARAPGLFVDLWNVSWRDAIAYIHDVFVASLLYPLSILLIKVAILLDWLVLFVPPGSRNFVYWAAHVMIWVNVVFYLSVLIAIQVACTPYEYSWNKLLDGNCHRVNTQYTNLASGIFNVISDIVILLIPQKVVWKLNMRTRMKVGVSMIFGIGLLGCIIAILRLVETVKYARFTDYTSAFSTLSGTILCSAAELTIGILVICIPSLPKAYDALGSSKLGGKLSSWSTSSRKRIWPLSRRSRTKSWPEPDYIKAPSLDRANLDQIYMFPQVHYHTKRFSESLPPNSTPAVEGRTILTAEC